ncbi:unnamed protein product [marine sediment metagenome]|uniref:Uncharacterized protein n=1 Tax=marine sediment metagenome TaxID=412755 RepID=X0Z009_9ZZZZ
MNKRGALTDLVLFIILAFTFSIILGLLYHCFSEIETQMLDSASKIQANIGGNANVTQIVQNSFSKVRQATESFKWIGTMLIVALFLSVIIHSFIVNAKPVYWISYLFIWMLSYILAVPISEPLKLLASALSFHSSSSNTYSTL